MEGSYIQITFKRVALVTVSLPLLGMTASVLLAILLHFKESVSTHCHVPNFLPSISAAIGGSTPERYIWRITIALHTSPRLFVMVPAYLAFYHRHLPPTPLWPHWLARLAVVLHAAEICSLVLLTFVSSTENFEVHEASFIAFIVCSQFYMLFSCVLFHHICRSKLSTESHRQSFTLKRHLFVANMMVFFTSVFLYFRHNNHCEPYVYSFFALCEYLTVWTNMGFHVLVGTHDMSDSVLQLTLPMSPSTYRLH